VVRQNYKRSVVSLPAVTLSDMKLSLGLEESFTDHDGLISRMITSAQYEVEDFLWMTLLTTTWELTQEEWSERIVLRRGPIASISRVDYYDTSNVLQELDSSNYFLSQTDDGMCVFVDNISFPDTYNRPDAVKVTFIAGETSISDTRPVEYIYFRVAEMYDNPLDEKMKFGMTTKAKNYLRMMRRNAFL